MREIICNPLNLEYRYQIKKSPMGNAVYREAADPTVLLFKDTYYMFASMSGGFWYSANLLSWQFKETPELPIYDYAPDVREVNGEVVFSASLRGEPCTFFKSPAPLTQPFKAVSTPFAFWDPGTFQDDDGRLYFYWGCTNQEPIWGIQLHPETLLPIGEKLAMFGENEANNGWERSGENNVLAEPKTEMEKRIREYLGTKPFIEGAYMNKHNGKYYLQYAAPGTQYNVYGDGVYVGNAPLGPFVYQPHNPFSSKPGGFITGAGHGSTFMDKAGNWWHASTMRISVNENFERRLGIFPCGFDAEGNLWCNQNFADYPFALPEGRQETIGSSKPQWMLLSYNKTASASSAQAGHAAETALNEDVRSWWAAQSTALNEWFLLDLGKQYDVAAIQLNFADHALPLPDVAEEEMHPESIGSRKILVQPQYTSFLLEGSTNNKDWLPIKDTRGTKTDFAHDFILLPQTQQLRFFRLTQMAMPMGGVAAISGLRVFGFGGGQCPAATQNIAFTRANRLNILLSWAAANGADGYNIRYGLSPGRLYSSWQIYGQTQLNLSMVNGSAAYYIAIDSFNESGVTPGEVFYVE